VDWGSIWEQRKRAFIEHLHDPYSQYGMWITSAILVLFVVVYAQHMSQRRALAIAARAIGDVRVHDECARKSAREAIQRYNDHIEICNRVIEGNEGGLWKWISSAELDAMKVETQRTRDELRAAQIEVKHLRDDLEKTTAMLAEISARQKGNGQATLPFTKEAALAQYVERINQLEQQLYAERKKNQAVKGTDVDARHN
jgi:hypothetical protein